MTNTASELSEFMADLARRHDVSVSAVESLFNALVSGRGVQAQFDHRELGGMGQWSGKGMIMIGDMFNTGLKARVDKICTELAGFMAGRAVDEHSAAGLGPAESSASSASQSWPTELGVPSSTGSQNGVRYAVFPAVRRVAIDGASGLEIFDSREHCISGVSQHQGSSQSIFFVSQSGIIGVAAMRKVKLSDTGQT